MLSEIVVAIIIGYQRLGGGEALFGINCDFNPSCSEYARQAIERHGLWKGSHLSLRRIKRCNRSFVPAKIDDLLC